MRLNAIILAAFGLSLMALIGLLISALAGPAKAHSWYPKECCHEYDCAPADSVEVVSPDLLKITSVHGTTYVPATFPRRDSPDAQAHICMGPDYLDGKRYQKPLCLFLPPSN